MHILLKNRIFGKVLSHLPASKSHKSHQRDHRSFLLVRQVHVDEFGGFRRDDSTIERLEVGSERSESPIGDLVSDPYRASTENAPLLDAEIVGNARDAEEFKKKIQKSRPAEPKKRRRTIDVSSGEPIIPKRRRGKGSR